MSKKNKKQMDPALRKLLFTIATILLVMMIFGGSCAGLAGSLGLKDLFPNIGFIPLFPEDRESIDLDADETASELESDTDVDVTPPEKESHEPPDVSESVPSSDGNVVDSESEGKHSGESESENPSGSESESESNSGGTELPGGSESEGEKPSESESIGGNESESENPGISESESESEIPGESESESESTSESESASESESEIPGESESESESNSNDDESTSESYPTDVITYEFVGLDIVSTGGTFTKEVVTIQAESSLDTALKTDMITITVTNDYKIVKVVLNCENNSYEFTIEITPEVGTIEFADGIVTIDVGGGTTELIITFNRNVRVDDIEVAVSN